MKILITVKTNSSGDGRKKFFARSTPEFFRAAFLLVLFAFAALASNARAASSTLGPYSLHGVWQQVRTNIASAGTPPTVVLREDYLPYLKGIVTHFRRYQEPDGGIIDEFQHREVQNATACYALAAAALVASSPDTNFVTSAALALDHCLQGFANADAKSPGADNSIAHAMLAYELLLPSVTPERQKHWQNLLRALNPEVAYHDRLTENRTRVIGYNVAALSGDFLRAKAGFGGTAFLDRHLPVQLRNFSNEGWYRDAYSPIAYDSMARYFFALLAWRGYDGPQKDLLLDLLDRGAVTSLLTQSPIGEIPTGGRGSQHQWNEAQQVFLNELWAARKKAEGDALGAQMFKRAARLSWQSILRWVRPSGELNTVKNAFDPAARHGFETYGSHSHFNLLAAAALALAWHVADDTILAGTAPAEVGGYAFELPQFRKIIANAGGLYVQIDTKADTNYQSTGFVRIHKTGVEGVVGPSDSIPWRREPLALGIAWREGDAWRPLAGELYDLTRGPKLSMFRSDPTNVVFFVGYPVNSTNVSAVVETYDLTPQRARITTDVQGTVQGTANEVRVRFPALMFTGVRATRVSLEGNTASVTLGKSRETFSVLQPPGLELRRTGEIHSGRNGFFEPIEVTARTNRVVYTLTPELLP